MAARVAQCTILEIEAVEPTQQYAPQVRQIAPWQDPWINQLLVARGLRLPLGSVLEALSGDMEPVDSAEPLVIGPLPVAPCDATEQNEDPLWWLEEDSEPLEGLSSQEVETLLGLSNAEEFETTATADDSAPQDELSQRDAPQRDGTAEGVFYRLDRPGSDDKHAR